MSQNPIYDMIMKPLAVIAAAIVLAFALGVAVGHCKIPPGTPGTTICSAEMDKATCAKFEHELYIRGYGWLRVLKGEAFGTVDEVKQMTYMVVLRCADKSGRIYKATMGVLKNVPQYSVSIEQTEERELQT